MSTKKKVETMELSGNRYAKVKDRLLEFWNDNPHGKIDTIPNIREDGRVLFAVRILKDKGDEFSAEATGHAIGDVGKKAKDFEKIETIAVGRALGLLGYASTGEVASGEEMEEFNEWKEEQFREKVLGWQEELADCKNEEELKKLWADMPVEVKKALEEQKNSLKARFSETNQEIVPEADSPKARKSRTKKTDDESNNATLV